MVKLNRIIDSDDEFPELSTIIAEGTLSFQKQRARIQERNPSEHPSSSIHGLISTTKISDEKHEGKKQRPLKIAHVNSILLSLTSRDALSTDPSEGRTRPDADSSPPRLKSPSRSPPPSQVVTPPASPTRLKLPSPNKRFHIPPSPHRPSIDAFWSQEVINDWNDSYTPRKSPSRNANAFKKDDKDYPSPTQTERRGPSKSPIKADKEAAGRRKAFNQNKYELAAAFFKELDQTIVNGQITSLAEPTGGVRLVWSKKLQSTAGRANWRREAIRTKDGEGHVSTTTYRHHASIELAEKVIDDEDRLINVIAHEYCHLLNFMISNIKDNPHGKEFKLWAKKCSTAFAHRGVNVTTTHVYEISYKYIWTCSKCGVEYKRHSKSIDPSRHSCSKCHEKLVQVKPTPRGEGKGISDYQQFVKRNFARVKRERPEMSMGEVMAALGKEFREAKEKAMGEVVVQVDEGLKVGGDEDTGLESVARKLDFLALGPD
ncbi:MAG: hypothetical protein L6R38_001285 [Xanthoria sp. 2 TBL-2021]|nr:MAG: hypothetical protein L6R38_001285 [Xanthoria sp. 2 TBL-2021]